MNSVRPNNLSLKQKKIKKLVAMTKIPFKKASLKKDSQINCHEKMLTNKINFLNSFLLKRDSFVLIKKN